MEPNKGNQEKLYKNKTEGSQ